MSDDRVVEFSTIRSCIPHNVEDYVNKPILLDDKPIGVITDSRHSSCGTMTEFRALIFDKKKWNESGKTGQTDWVVSLYLPVSFSVEAP